MLLNELHTNTHFGITELESLMSHFTVVAGERRLISRRVFVSAMGHGVNPSLLSNPRRQRPTPPHFPLLPPLIRSSNSACCPVSLFSGVTSDASRCSAD